MQPELRVVLARVLVARLAAAQAELEQKAYEG